MSLQRRQFSGDNWREIDQRNEKTSNENIKQQMILRPHTNEKSRLYRSKNYKVANKSLVQQPRKTISYGQSVYCRKLKKPSKRKSTSNHIVDSMKQQTQAQRIKVSFLEAVRTNSEFSKNALAKKLNTSNQIFKKVDFSLTESIVYLGKLSLYSKGEVIQTNHEKVGFIIFGRVRMFNKDFEMVVRAGQTYDQHFLFKNQTLTKIRCIDDVGILWLQLNHYQILREQSIKSGLKNQFYSLEVQMRLSFIKKKLK